jgi:hypothetical protein
VLIVWPPGQQAGRSGSAWHQRTAAVAQLRAAAAAYVASSSRSRSGSTKMSPRRALCAALTAAAALLSHPEPGQAAIPQHLVSSVPTFPNAAPIPFKYFSGYLEVAGPFEQNPYDKVKVRYELQMSMSGNASDPLVSWHQGGPGWSSVFGSWGEMGYFQLGGGHGDSNFVNDYSWNQRAHMLYIEGPVGSAHPIGFGSCWRNGALDFPCTWNDTSQAEMYARTLLEFFKHYPELHSNDYYISGESYGGRFIPNIANHILTSQADINLKVRN